jgi:hypothetical protein
MNSVTCEICNSVKMSLLGVVMHLIQLLLPNHHPHVHVAYPVSTDGAPTTESQRDNCYTRAGGNVGTHRVCPEALKVATLPLGYIHLASNQLMGILIAFKVLQNYDN